MEGQERTPGVVEPTASAAILGRRETLRFEAGRVPDDPTIVRLLRLASEAPSAYGLQPWRFLLIRSEPNRRRLRECVHRHPAATEAPLVLVVLGFRNGVDFDLEPMLRDRLDRGASTPAEAAELRGRAISAFARLDDRGPIAVTWAMAGATTLLIAAEGLGLATCPIVRFDEDRLRPAFGIPDDHEVACLIAVGYPHPEAIAPHPGRFPLGRICHQEHFGQPWTLGEDAS